MAKNTSGQYNGNLVIMTLIEAVNKFDGLLMGIGGSNNYYTFNADKTEREKFKKLSVIDKNQTEAAEETVEDDQQLREKTAIRRAFFSTLLDTAAGAYYSHDILAGNAIMTKTGKGMNEHDLASVRIEDYIRILADTSSTGNSIIPATVYLVENDSKIENKSIPMQKSTYASISRMIREGAPSQKTNDSLNVAAPAPPAATVPGQEGVSTFDADATVEEKAAYLQKMNYLPKNSIVNDSGFISSPSLDNNTMAAYVIKENEFHFGNRRKEFLSLFFNGIPPIEMSRCTPYVELTFYHQNFAENKESYLNPAGYMNFYAEIDTDTGKLKPAMFKSRPANEEYHAENLIQTDISYMDLFNSPQTMVNADINNTDKPNLFSNESKTSPYNHALEPFAPQATLNGLTITTTSGGYGFTSEKKGSLSLTIHDRSRLKQFASIIAVNHLAKSRVKITFGWNHPDADILSDNIFGRFLNSMKNTQMYTLTSSDMRFQGNSIEVDINLVSMGNHHIEDMPAAAGEFIPLRVVNPAIVTIVEALVEKEKRKRGKVDTGKIGMVHPQLDLLIQASNSMEAMVSAIEFKELLSEIRENNIMGSDVVKSQDIVKKIAKMLGITEISENDSFRVVVDKIEEATAESTTSSASISKRVYDDLRKKSAQKLREKYESLFTSLGDEGLLQPDYFTENCLVRNVNPDWANFVGGKFFSKTEYVSLGKLIANFVAAPMIATGEYSEVQLFFYPMNQACGGGRCFTTASFPISRNELDSIFEIENDTKEKEATKKDSSIENGTISAIGMFNRIASLLNSYDIDAYGLTSISSTSQKKDYDALIGSKKKDENILRNFYSKTFSGGALTEKVKAFKTLSAEDKESEWKTAVNSYVKEQASAERTKVLSEIYKSDIAGAPQNSETFRFPTLNLSFEVVQPIKPPSPTETEFMDLFFAKNAYYNDKDTNAYTDGRILKIHVTDDSNVGGSKVDLATQILFDGSKDPVTNDAIAEIIKDGVNNLSDSELKEYIKRHYATLIYGSSNGVVKSLNISSSTSDRIAQAKMMTFEKNRRSLNISKNVNTLADSVKIIPASIDLQMLGCPFIERGSQLFIDMGTNTDLDNCYTVNSVTHTINKGDFTTSLGLVVSHQGTIANTRGNILQKLKKAIPDIK